MTYYQRINLGNFRDFVIKNIDEPETYGTFQFGDEYDKKSMDEFIEKVNSIIKENQELKEENKSWLKTASRMDTIHHEDREYCERIHRENEKLKQENQQYKSLLRDMGLLRPGEDAMALCNNFADKIIKPIFAESGFDVDVDTSNGFAISLKEEKE